MRHVFVGSLVAVCIAACGANASHDFDSSNGNGSGALGDGGSGGTLTGGGEGGTPAKVGDLAGKVFAPEGTIPISGALIYLTTGSPAPIPDGTYCDKCTTIDANTPFTYSNTDGSFDLPAYVTGAQQLVVQKGAFRRIRSVTVSSGSQTVDPAMTTLPGKTDASLGDNIPKMAVVAGAWDHIEVTLEKLGLGKLTGSGGFDKSSAPFDYYENSLSSSNPYSPRKLITDAATIGQ
ncbi:MAG: hypothetical protein ABI183_24580, partial [Polyangiaceae bacterium]